MIKLRLKSGDCSLIKSNGAFQLAEVDGLRRYALHSLPESIPAIEMKYLSSIMEWGKQNIAGMEGENIDGMILMESISPEEVRSVTFEMDGAILRSPGVDSTFAIYTALLEKGEQILQIVNHSIFGSQLSAIQDGESAHRFSIETQAFVTGEHQFLYDQEDPLEYGFLLK